MESESACSYAGCPVPGSSVQEGIAQIENASANGTRFIAANLSHDGMSIRNAEEASVEHSPRREGLDLPNYSNPLISHSTFGCCNSLYDISLLYAVKCD